MSRRRRSVGAGLGVALCLSGALVTAGSAPARAEPTGVDCREINTADTVAESEPTAPSDPLVELQVARAHEIVDRLSGGREPGAGVRVAVIDSGVTNAAIDLEGVYNAPPPISAGPDPSHYHGTAMAGVIAGDPLDGVGLVGIAPGATVFDVRVYDTDQPGDDSLKTATEAGLIAGLDQVARVAGTGPGDVRVVNVSLAVRDGSPELLAAVQRVTATGAIVVASSGNRDLAESDEEEGVPAFEPGEDAGDTWFPAGYAKTEPLVLAVGTTTSAAELASDAPPAGLLSSAIDVVAPSYGAVSYAVNGSACSFTQSSTSVAAAEVSGVLAMLMTAFPRESPQRLLERLESTATASAVATPGSPDTYAGRGVVQPVDALTRRLPTDPGAGGGTVEERALPAALPEPEPDVLRGTRRNAVWWGLFGGGALVVALLLRPVLSRRRGRG